MSEFTEAYYLRTKEQSEAIALLERAKHSGYVFPEKDGWVTFVINSNFSDTPETLRRANTGILVHFINAEDHGWGFEIFYGEKLAMSYKCDINDEGIMQFIDLDRITEPDYTPEPIPDDFEMLLYTVKQNEAVLHEVFQAGPGTEDMIDVLAECKADAAEKRSDPNITAAIFAERMGLFFSEWVSFDYAEGSYEQDQKMFFYGKFGSFLLTKVGKK